MAYRWHDNPERDKALRTLWDKGLSGQQIANAFGDCSRGSVIGRAHRLHLTSRKRTDITLRQTQTKPIALVGIPKPISGRPGREPARLRRQRKKLLQLTQSTCRYPIGDPQQLGFFFCGAKPVRGFPYCVEHCLVCYRPAAPMPRAYIWGEGRIAK